MDNFYGGRRGPKGDTIADIQLDEYGVIQYKLKSYLTSTEDGATIDNNWTPASGCIPYVQNIEFGNGGVITYIFANREEEGSEKHATRTDDTWNFPASRVTYKDTDIDAYIKSLDYKADLSTSKTITSITETDGLINIVSNDISIGSSQINDKKDTYNASGTEVVTGKAVNAALQTLDVSKIGGDAKYIKSVTEVDGKISAEVGNTSEFATSNQGAAADTAVQSVKITASGTELKSGTSVVLPAYPTTLPASDVHDWAKEENKPTYTANEVGALPSTTQPADIGALPSSAIVLVPAEDWSDEYETTQGVIYVVYNADGSAEIHVGV